MIKLDLLRYDTESKNTLGMLFGTHLRGSLPGQRRLLCHTLEDTAREVKIAGRTRIPAGSYQVTLRTVGGFHSRYRQRFPELHRGMLWIREVPNFEYVLIHCGNDEDDTAGCVLLGEEADPRARRIISSTSAYKRVYPIVAEELVRGGQVQLDITDFA